MKCNQSRPGFELVSSCPILATITITPRALQYSINALSHDLSNSLWTDCKHLLEHRTKLVGVLVV